MWCISYSAFKDCLQLTDVYYLGTEVDWSHMTVVSGNSWLTGATRSPAPW